MDVESLVHAAKSITDDDGDVFLSEILPKPLFCFNSEQCNDIFKSVSNGKDIRFMNNSLNFTYRDGSVVLNVFKTNSSPLNKSGLFIQVCQAMVICGDYLAINRYL